MEETRSNKISVLVLVILLGLFVEVLKGIRRSQMATARNADLLADAAVTPFHVSDATMRAEARAARMHGFSPSHGMSLAGQPNKPGSYDFSGGRVAKKNKKATGKPETKKKAKKKKKKKEARGKKTPTPLDAANDLIPQQVNPTNNTDNSPNAAASSPAPKAPNSPANSNNPNLPITYNDWAKLLLGAPNKAGVQKLIQYYRSNMVTSQIFYQLLTAMASQSNQDQQLLAIYAAGQISNAKSFGFLVTVMKVDGSNSAVATADSQYIDGYSSLNNVPMLRQVFSMYLADPTIIQVAAQVLNTSTSNYLGSRTPTANPAGTPAAGGNQTGGAAITINSLVHAYAGYLPVLQTVMNAYKQNAQLVSLLQNSYDLIKHIEPAT